MPSNTPMMSEAAGVEGVTGTAVCLAEGGEAQADCGERQTVAQCSKFISSTYGAPPKGPTLSQPHQRV
ncbi:MULTISPECIES: hypothetical protein [Azospirillum]|uniref:Uncharacterized protein n=2 Tax=Azospirillum brasilense TaxID=192 RepID=A0ABU4P5E3_AZOBR|nr:MULTISPECIES: hypothetical protein [Azospirillum]MDW7557803.1 hypothetical protein [Azospirillum brasilense]MDW7597437.1 hypothetical protein [Azospirillum brasilense]MDW7632700.1 hypothetical protein [Azospirillum brasilense]MDX5952443.1 hypothetical protein [Azospirillum brasilense]